MVTKNFGFLVWFLVLKPKNIGFCFWVRKPKTKPKTIIFGCKYPGLCFLFALKHNLVGPNEHSIDSRFFGGIKSSLV